MQRQRAVEEERGGDIKQPCQVESAQRTGKHGKVKTRFVAQLDSLSGCDQQGPFFWDQTDHAQVPS